MHGFPSVIPMGHIFIATKTADVSWKKSGLASSTLIELSKKYKRGSTKCLTLPCQERTKSVNMNTVYILRAWAVQGIRGSPWKKLTGPMIEHVLSRVIQNKT